MYNKYVQITKSNKEWNQDSNYIKFYSIKLYSYASFKVKNKKWRTNIQKELWTASLFIFGV